MTAPIVVVGAGFGGLASALMLAQAGHAVLVLERAARPGGKAGIADVDSVQFDTGPSLITLTQVVDALASEVGRSASDWVQYLPLDPAFRYQWPDGASLVVRHTLSDTLTEVEASFGAPAGKEFASFMQYARSIWEASAPSFVFGEAPSLSSLLRTDLRTLAQLRHIDAMRSMYAAISARVREPHLRTLLARFATYNGSDVRSAPATLNCIAWVEMGLGGYGVRGGVYSLVQALEAEALRLGAQFEYNCHVVALHRHVGRAATVELADGRQIAASAVVANADANSVFGELLRPPAASSPRRPAPSMSAYNAVFAASRRLRRNRCAHTAVFAGPYLNEFADIFDHHRAPSQPTVYACDQTLAHQRAGWSDADPLFVMINTPPLSRGGHLDTAEVERLRGFARQVALGSGWIDTTDPIVWERTPEGLATHFPGSDGSLYGAASNSRMAAFHRPTNRVRDVPGLYLASGSAHPGGGVPLAILSGMAAARALTRDLSSQ